MPQFVTEELFCELRLGPPVGESIEQAGNAPTGKNVGLDDHVEVVAVGVLRDFPVVEQVGQGREAACRAVEIAQLAAVEIDTVEPVVTAVVEGTRRRGLAGIDQPDVRARIVGPRTESPFELLVTAAGDTGLS